MMYIPLVVSIIQVTCMPKDSAQIDLVTRKDSFILLQVVGISVV